MKCCGKLVITNYPEMEMVSCVGKTVYTVCGRDPASMACFGDDLFDFVENEGDNQVQVLPDTEEVSKHESDK